VKFNWSTLVIEVETEVVLNGGVL